MTTEQQAVLATIDDLRRQYATPNQAVRNTILQKIEKLKEEYKLIHCKECKRLCFNDSTDEHWPFCGETCHTTWADTNYGPKGETKGLKSIAEIQAQINRMKKDAILKKHETQQTLL